MDLDMLPVVGFGIVMLAIVLGIVRSARRFEAEQRRRGLWDDKGPLHPTQGPPRGKGGMGERLEVIGEYEPTELPRDDVAPKELRARRPLREE